VSIELTLLLTIFAALLLSVIVGDRGVPPTFSDTAPRLGVRLEKYIETGSAFTKHTEKITWSEPNVRQKGYQ